jgi:hypothetical protein
MLIDTITFIRINLSRVIRWEVIKILLDANLHACAGLLLLAPIEHKYFPPQRDE